MKTQTLSLSVTLERHLHNCNSRYIGYDNHHTDQELQVFVKAAS